MIMALFALPNIASACDYQLKMIDSYGDGWNGGKVTVFVNGTAVITDATIASGAGPEYVTFAANTGDLITTDYTADSYPGENEYYILDATGAEIAAEGANGGTPSDITTAITAACPLNYDAGMIDILYLNISGNQAVKAVITNYGIVTLTSATVNWTIDGGVQTPASWTGSIATGEKDTVVIGTVTISQGNHTIIASSDLPNGVSDENLSNDTNSRTSYFIGAHAFPLTEDFESGFDKFTNASGNDIDFIVETTLFHSGAQSVKNVTQDGYNSNIMHELGLLDLSSTSYPALEFWHIAKTEGNWDKCYIEISTDGGQSYTTIDDSLYMGNTANYAVKGYFHEDSYTEWGTGSQTPDNTWWKKEKFDLTPFKNDSVRIRFRYTTDSGTERYGWLIDDISVNEQPVDEIEVVEIIGTYGGFGQGNYTVQAIVKNNGLDDQTGFDINYLIEGGSVETQTISTLLAAFTTDTFTFATTVASSAAADTLSLAVYSTLNGDEDISNDTAYVDVINMAIPYEEGFEAYAANATPDFWTVLNNTGSSYAYAKVYSSNTHTGSKSFSMYNSGGYGANKSIIASLPMVNSGLINLRMEFWLKGGGSDLIIGIMDDPTDSSTFVGIDTLFNPPTSYNEYAVMFNAYAGSGKYIAFKHDANYSYDYFYIDDIKLFVPPTHEVQITEIIRNYGGFDVPTTDTVTVLVKNNGTSPQAGFDIKYQLDNGSIVTEQMPTLAAFSTDTFEFAATFDASAGGNHNLMVYTSLTGDEDNTNDTMNKPFITYGTHTIPFTEDFEAGYTYFENDAANSTGFNINTTLFHSGAQSVKNAYASNIDDVLHEAGAMDLSASTTPVFDFWHIALTEGCCDKGYIEISTDNGDSWVIIDDSLYLGESSYTDKFTGSSYTDWSSGGATANNSLWKMERFNLEAFKDDSVRIRFRLDSDGSVEKDGWYIDDITIQEEPDAVASLGNDTTLCAGTTLDLNSGSAVGYTYLWTSDGDTLAVTTSSITVDSSATYTVEITGVATVAYDTIIVTDVDLPTIASFTTADEICIGDDATLEASFTGATPWNFSYAKIGVDTTDVTAAASPWTSSFALTDTSEFVIIEITDANGCISTMHSDTLNINVNPLPVVAITSLSDVCANDGVFTYTQGSGPAGGSGYYSGTGVDSATSTFNAATAAAGSHTITYTYTDSNACINSATEIQIVNALPAITAIATDNPVPYNTSTTLTASVSNAVGTISYAWTPSGNITETDTTTASLTTTNALSTVNYVVKVIDDGTTCSTNDTIVLPYSGGPISIAPSASPTAICNGGSTNLSANPSGGSGTVTYSWTSNPAGYTSTDADPTVSPTVDTWYILEAQDDISPSKDSVLISIIADPIIAYAVDTTYGCFGSNAEAIVNITGLAPFSYTYNGIITNANNNTDTVLITAGADATYKLTSVTDANGCTATSDFDSIVVSAWALPLAVASADATICFGDSTEISIDLTGMAPWTFDVFDGTNTMNVASATSPFTVFADPDSTVKYTIVSVTDGHSCNTTANIDSITVFVNQLATATVSDNDTMCFGDSVQLAINFNGAAPYTFDVTDGTNPMSFTSASDIFNVYVGPDAATTYTLTSIGDANGCVANNLTEATEVFVNPLPTAPTFTGLAADYCEDAAVVTLVGAPTGGLFSGSGITASDFDPSTAASGANDIEYRITDANGCENFVINSTTINTLPSITISGLASAYCVDAPAATLTATPTGTGGVWSGAVNASVEFEASVSGVGNHTVYYEFTDANGCVNMDSAITLVNALPVVAVTTLADVCFDEPNFMPIGATPVGGTWTGAGVMSNYFNAATAGAGSHYLTYTFTDANGCINLDSTTQVVNALPVLTVTGFASNYCDNDDADTLIASPLGGTFYGSGLTANVFDPTASNTGTLNILYMYTDANGCFNSLSSTTNVNISPIVDLGSDNTVCEDASAILDAGNTGSTFVWNTGATTQTINIDTTGYGIGTYTYSVLVTDANGCANSNDVDITYEALPTSQLSDTSSICGVDADITLDAGYVSGNTYNWSNGQTWSYITINSTDLGGTTGTMSLVITSANGCITNDETYVYFREEPIIDLGADQEVCFNHEYTIDAGTGYTSYLWNTGATTQSITVDSNDFSIGDNLYKVEVYNDVNCSAMDSVVLVVDPCTGVEMPELTKADISIYPNPTKGQFQIDVTGLENKEYNLDIFNSVGKIVFTEKVTYDGTDTQTWKLDFSTYAKGIYHIRLISNGDIKVKRIVVQ